MKQFATLLLTACLLFAGRFAGAQKALDPNTPLNYLGIDFTGLKVINDAGATTADLKSKYFPAINQLTIAEAKKYDWQGALGVNNFSSDLAIVTARNEKVDESKLFSTNTADDAHLKEEDIRKYVSQYNLSGKKGTGLVVFYETFNKSSETGSMWVTFIDLDTKKVLLTERMSAKGAGFSYRNYWAAPIYKVIQEIKKHKAKEWRNKI